MERHRILARHTIALFLLTSLLWTVLSVQAQDEQPPVEKIIITGTSVESLPAVELRLYGRDAQGNPIDFSVEALDIMHGDTPASLVNYQGAHRTGTFTIFLIDIPTGIQEQLPALQEVIMQYASPGNMLEQIDYAAVYQVGANGAIELLPATEFHNSVRNVFVEPLNPESGATALYDSTADLLSQAGALVPNSEMPIQIVLMTDGTDAISAANSGDSVIQQASELGIPIHTVWLNNADINSPGVGQDYLANLAASSGGVAVQLENATDLALIWNRIAGFRDQARIRYEVSGLTGGTFPVTVTLANTPWIADDIEVTIPFNIPSVVIDLPADARTLTLANVEDAVPLRFRTDITWVDGEEREVTSANLIINGDTSTAFEIPLASLDEFIADVPNLNYGNNTVEVSIVDDEGRRATSPTVILTVNEGRNDIPAELNGGNPFLRFATNLLLVLFVVTAVFAVLLFLWQRGTFSRKSEKGEGRDRRRSRRSSQPTTVVEDAAPAVSQATAIVGYLDVLDSVTRMEPTMPLQGSYVRIGRSPAQCEIAFQNDITVSRLHANLQLEGNDYRVFDENSTSGTFVNEQAVPEYGIQLLDGDEIHIGAVHLRYRRA